MARSLPKTGDSTQPGPQGHNMLLGASGGSGWAPHRLSGGLLKKSGGGVATGVPADILEVQPPAVNPPVERQN